MLGSDIWCLTDFYAEYQSTQSLPVEATFSARGWIDGFAGHGKTRIDHIFLNSAALAAAKDASIFRGPLAPGHAPVVIGFEHSTFSTSCWSSPSVPKWMLPQKPSTHEEWDSRNKLCMPVFQRYLPCPLEHAENLRVEAFWGETCNMIHDMLNTICQQNISSSRGSIPDFYQKRFVPPACRESSCQSRVERIRRLLHELSIKVNHWKPSHSVWMSQLERTIHHVNRELAWLGCSLSSPDLSIGGVSGFIEQGVVALLAFESSQQHIDSFQRINQWKERLRLSNARDRKQVHAWLKGQPPQHPKVLRCPDNSLTGDPNEILAMLTSHIEKIYSTHEGVNEQQLFDDFCSKYSNCIDALRNPAHIPDLDAKELWAAFQSKPDHKASGLDQWKVSEIKALPECAWQILALFYRLVEATGQWPASFKMVSITAIPKEENNWTPETTRAIAIASIFYSHWASIRFKHLSHWSSSIAPASLLGGLPHRSAVESEVSLSSELFEHELFEGEARMVVFVDRLKCFDLLLPGFCIALAKKLGLPDKIAKAVAGFYRGQVKFFKLGHAYGNRVLHCNGVLQGCSFSVLFANLVFSVFAKHMESFPDISFASFIDDTKIWAKISDFPSLVQATNELSFFDAAVGQIQNDNKSLVLSRKKKDAQRFLAQVGRRFPIRKQAKSLGFSHQVTKRGGAAFQDKRMTKALKAAQKIRHLPLPPVQKALFIKSNSHSKWIYGSEVQAPSKTMIKKLRTSVVNAIFPRNNNMRCPFLCLATFPDVWVDPWARWVLHILSTYRKLSRTNPNLVKKVCAQAKAFHGIETRNGAPVALSRIIKELRWEWTEDPFVFAREDDLSFSLVNGSQDFFMRELERSVRRVLFMCSPERCDNPGESRGRFIDMKLTRFFADNDFSNQNVFGAVSDILQELPTTIEHARRILQYIITGSVYDGVRKFKAGIIATDQCEHCGERNTFLHSVKNCSAAQCPQFDISFPDTTWATGIFFESEETLNLRRRQFNNASVAHVPPPRELDSECSDVFIDGSCYRSYSKRFSQSAAAVYIPGICSFATELPGLDHSSQRSEISALNLALKMFQGNLQIYTDCSSVVKGFRLLQTDHFNCCSLHGWDNLDLWQDVCRSARQRQGSVSVLKVAAHGRDRSQNPYLTHGNSQVDDLARNCAKRAFERLASNFLPEIISAVSLQIHLIKKFHDFSTSQPVPANSVNPNGRTCTCIPGCRLRKKQTLLCTCSASSNFRPSCSVEECFLNLVSRRDFIPDHLWGLLQNRYPVFSQWIEWKGRYCMALPSADVIPARTRKLPLEVRELISKSFVECGWSHGHVPLLRYTPWLFFLVEVIVRYGWIPGFLYPELGLGTMVQRFRCHWIHFLETAFPVGLAAETLGSKLGCQFGLGRQRAFGIHLNSGCKMSLWTLLIQVSMSERFQSRRWKPDWNLILDFYRL